jgi:DNA-binding transcriptional LysR family regulator
MHFDLTDLRLFIRTAEESNLTRAANRQCMSVAAASVRIKALEEQAGIPLLYRAARGVNLTPAGMTFLHHAKHLVRQAELLRADLSEFGQGTRGHVRILANTTTVTDILPEVLAEFFQVHPGVNIDLQEKQSAEIPTLVSEGLAEIGIVAGNIDTLALESVHFATDRLVVATPSAHPLASRDGVTFAEVVNEDFIGLHGSSTLQTFLNQMAESCGHQIKQRVQVYSFDAICRMVSAGAGVAILPLSSARRHSAHIPLSLVNLVDAWSERKRYLVVRERDALPQHSLWLLQRLRAFRHDITHV